MRQSKINWNVKEREEDEVGTKKKRKIQTKISWEVRDDCWKKEIEAIDLACSLNDQKSENKRTEKIEGKEGDENRLHVQIDKEETNNDNETKTNILSVNDDGTADKGDQSKNQLKVDATAASITKKNDHECDKMDLIEQSSMINEIKTDNEQLSGKKVNNDKESKNTNDKDTSKAIGNEFLTYTSGSYRNIPLIQNENVHTKQTTDQSLSERKKKAYDEKISTENIRFGNNNDEKAEMRKVENKSITEGDDSLLAGALGDSAIVANTIDYESSVLSKSQILPSIPQLFPATSQHEWKCGYPSLESNYNFSRQTWMQTFYKIDDLLHPTYAKKESETAIVLRMQYFATLHHLQKSNSNNEEQTCTENINALSTLLDQKEQQKYEKERKLQFEKRKHSLSLRRNNKKKHKKSRINGNESDDSLDEYNNKNMVSIMTPSERLQQVKKGKNTNVLSLCNNSTNNLTSDEYNSNSQGQAQALSHRQYHTAIFVWRKSQRKKRRRNYSNPNGDTNNLMDPHTIYQKRKERWERRMLRRQKYISQKPKIKKSATSPTYKISKRQKHVTNNKINSSKASSQKKRLKKKTATSKTRTIVKANNVNATTSLSTQITPTTSTTSSLNSNAANNSTDKDVDKSGNNTKIANTDKRNYEWSTRPRRNVTKGIISYSEIEDTEIEDEVIEHKKEKNSTSEPFNDDESEIDAEDDFIHLEAETECLEDSSVDDEEGTSNEGDNNLSQFDYDHENPPLDDWFEYDYEDRVDYWIENCEWKEMSRMKEADANEVPPGPVQYCANNNNYNYEDDPNRGKVLNVPAWVNNALFPYQRTGLQWLWELHLQQCGGIVGDEMGLGKTVQICSFLGCLAAGRHIKSILVVTPATILSSWLSHMKKWAPGLRRILIHKSHDSSHVISKKLLNDLNHWLQTCRQECWYEAIDENDLEGEKSSDDQNTSDINQDKWNKFCGTGYVIITSYENLRRNSDIYISNRWSYVVMDEGQKIRNPDADVTLACKKIRTPHRLLLSGTPIQNDLRELWSLFDFVFPGRLGTLPTFESEFADPIKKGGYANASPAQVQLAYRCALILRDLINPFLIRRQKKDIKEVSRMPGKTEHVLFCKLTLVQRSMYEAYLNSDEVTNVIRGSAQCFRPIIMLRKICNHPDLICDDDPSAFDKYHQNDNTDSDASSDHLSDKSILDGRDSLFSRSGKLEVLAKILPLWNEQGHRVLIFSQWKKMLNIIQHFLISQGFKFLRMDGNTNVASRQTLVDSFNGDDSVFAMLLTTKTGGVGLNLTGADRIILYDPDWNPQSDSQARERAWRFGQRNAVTVYRLITAGTIEEKIYQRQIFKTALTNQVLQDPRQKRLFSRSDLRDLFTLKPDLDNTKGKGSNMTETVEITKGKGVINLDENVENLESNQNDNKVTLELVMKSKGLAGVFDHDFVDKSSSVKKSQSVKEMEKKAKKIAEQSAKTLQQSSRNEDRFTPTWTGCSKTETSRFGRDSRTPSTLGSQQKIKQAEGPKFDCKFGGASTVGLRNISRGETVSSRTLLARFRERNSRIENIGNKRCDV